MAKLTNVPDSTACARWETLMVDALDGLLASEEEAAFAAHKANCQACAALFEQARQGREWLEFLSSEPEIPAGLVDRILANTGPGVRDSHPVMAGAGAMALPGGVPAWQRPGFMGLVRRWAEPRLMMTAAMAFFSIALTLSLAGVRLSQIRWTDLRPTAVRSIMERRLTMASVPVIRYYDHLRLVDEVQSRMKELWGEYGQVPQQNRNQTQPAGPGESKSTDGGSRAVKSGHRGAPAQARTESFGRYVDTAFAVPNQRQIAAPNSRIFAGNELAFGQRNDIANSKSNKNMTLQNRAFRQLRNRAERASERSRVWTA